MARLFLPSTVVVGAGVLLTVAAARTPDPQPVVVHEWGTFTSVAGHDGQPVPWRPLSRTSDLPGFVRQSIVGEKGLLTATVRMETPVIYFYADDEVTVDVRVGFRQGLVTEHYPRAAVGFARPGLAGLAMPGHTHTIAWRNVRVQPGAAAQFPVENAPSHYYAARATDAAPLQVGPDREGFLFYRGIGTFALPVTGKVGPDGVSVAGAGLEQIPAVILFENRRGRIGWRVQRGPARQAAMTLPPQEGDLASLREEIERLLVGEGLYQKEAAAMVETWSDSWFEEGTRLFYLLPQQAVDAILPLEIRPAPLNVVRVFVARIELVTPATLTDLADALTRHDHARLARYGRFLRPFAERLLAGPLTAAERASFSAAIDAVDPAAETAAIGGNR